jgi:tetratricopeptide (TPR) repeat protein
MAAKVVAMRRTALEHRTMTVILLLAFIFSVGGAGAAQDPAGRPTIPKHKKPTVKPKPVPDNTITLTIMSQPAECKVFINGEDRGTTDSEGKIVINKLPGGHYMVEVRKQGFMALTRGFEAGTEQPTLVFKLIESTETDVKKFESLVASGKLTRPDDPNAVDFIKELSNKFPDRPEIARLRSDLFQKLTEQAEAAVKATVSNPRGISDEVIVRGRKAASGAVELKDDDNRARAFDLYLEGAHLLRTWQASLKPGPAESGKKGIDGPKPQHPEDVDTARLNEIRLKFANAAEIQSSWAPPLYQSGIVLLLLKDYPAAEADFTKAIQRDPSWAAPHVGLGSALYERGKAKEAIEEYSKAIQIDPRSCAAYAGRGLALHARAQAKESTRDLDKAVELDGTSALPHLYRGIILSQSKKKKEQETALEELKRAEAMNPDNIEFPNSVADLHITNLKAKLGAK